MFDIGFAELLVIGIVALLVIGPDKLPDTIRTVAMWLGRLKRTYSRFRQDLEKEIGADEIRRQLHNESIMADLKRAEQEMKSAINPVDKPSSEPRNDKTSASDKSGATDNQIRPEPPASDNP